MVAATAAASAARIAAARYNCAFRQQAYEAEREKRKKETAGRGDSTKETDKETKNKLQKLIKREANKATNK